MGWHTHIEAHSTDGVCSYWAMCNLCMVDVMGFGLRGVQWVGILWQAAVSERHPRVTLA